MKKKNQILPGKHIGQRSKKDDSVPHIQHQREMTTQAGDRGRTEPRRGPTPPKARGSTPKK